MCGIAGAKSEKSVKRLIEEQEHRGGSTGVKEEKGFFLGHRLHSIVGQVKQPLKETGILTTNCEIYNWEELESKYGLDVANDAELVLKMLERKGIEALDELDGVYAFAYLKDGKIILGRDIMGVNPIWYSRDPFVFASEKQALESQGLECRELHPRNVLKYDIDSGSVSTVERDFFEIDTEEEKDLDQTAEEIKYLFLEAVEKRVPEEEEVGLLFSGGVDSTMVAAALQELDVEFTAYSSGIQHGNVDAPRDVDWSERIADRMNIDLEMYEAELSEVEEALERIPDWISSTSVVKNGVALPFHLALNGGEKVVMSGLGSEQLYAGYHRHQGYLNKECLSGLRKLFEQDLYRDNVISLRNSYEMRIPFLDQSLIEHALRIPSEMKREDGYKKYVLRRAAEKLGVPEEVAWRGKTAAQYGSNFDKAISRLSKDKGYKHKQEYINSFREQPNNRVVALTSGGKDSNAALYRLRRRNNKISCLLSLKSENKDSYMFDSKKEKSVIEKQSEQLDIPLIVQQTEGKKEKELEDLKKGLEKAVEKYDVEAVVTGALASTYQRDRVEKISEELGLKVFAPLWQEDQESYMRWLIREGFEIELTEVAARGLEKHWEGTVLDEENVEKLIDLSQKYGFNAAGEGGEYETKVVGFPKSLINT